MARWDTIQVEGQPMRVYLDVPAGARNLNVALGTDSGLSATGIYMNSGGIGDSSGAASPRADGGVSSGGGAS